MNTVIFFPCPAIPGNGGIVADCKGSRTVANTTAIIKKACFMDTYHLFTMALKP